MLLALWFDFWNPVDWVQGPTPPVPDVQTRQDAGHSKKPVDVPEYLRADSDFWDAREAMMRRNMPVESSPEQTAVLKKTIEKYNRLVQKIAKVPDLAHLRQLETEIKELTLQISVLGVDSDEDALLVLLL